MKVVYVGPCRAVEVPLPFGGDSLVVAGDSLNTTDEHALSLLEQPANWELAKGQKPPKASEPETEVEAPAEVSTTEPETHPLDTAEEAEAK